MSNPAGFFTFGRKGSKAGPSGSSRHKWLLYFVLPLLITWVLLSSVFYVAFGIDIVDGSSMNPGMHDRDLLFYRRVGLDPKPGDIVIIDIPERGKRIVKRVIAFDGQTVTVDEEGRVFLDSAALKENYANYGEAVRRYDTQFPFTVPEGRLFVLGDNRVISLDSRYVELGCVDKSQVIGEVLFIFHPFN